MARELADLALVWIDSASQGTKNLDTVMSIKPANSDGSRKAVKTMNRNRRAIGFTKGIDDHEAELGIVREPSNPEVDWDHLRRTKEVFLLGYQLGEPGAGGDRYKFVDATVVDHSFEKNAEGEIEERVKILALDHKKE